MTVPFIIYGLPRSRTAWLSVFLSYKEVQCFHEIAVCMRSIEDVRKFFSRPAIGTCETAAAQGRDLLRYVVPNIKEVVVLRPVEEVIDSFLKIDTADIVKYDHKLLRRNMEYGDRVLRKIAKDRNVLVIEYKDLDKEETCANIFEHCLPYRFDKEWWLSLKDDNIQADIKGVLGYYHKNRTVIEAFKRICKSELRRLFYSGAITKEMRV